MARPAITFDIDDRQAQAALGFIQELSASFRSNRYTSSVLKYTHSQMSKDFDRYMRNLAKASPESFNHVFEWRMNGLQKGQLWKHTLVGHGADRVASWEWLASKTNIPTPMERRRNPKDPMHDVKVSDRVLQQMSRKRYKFVWKAQIMEYNLPVTIVARNSPMLFVPTFDPTVNNRGFFMTQMTRVQNPGGTKTTGQFTRAWVAYWSQVAPRTWDAQIKRTIERDLGRAGTELTKAAKTQRLRQKGVSLTTGVNEQAAFNTGKAYAEAFIAKQAERYDKDNYYEPE